MLVFGCGYLGFRVACRAAQEGIEIWGTTRDSAKGETLRAHGIRPVLADWTDRRTLRDLPPVDRVLVSVSFDSRGRANREEGQVGGLRNLLDAISPETAVCYISTTGVYHQSDGSWVDETSPTKPTRDGARVHLRGESLLHRLRPESPWTILRLAGIYGPGRVPRMDEIRTGRAIGAAADSFLNLIHVDDAVTAVAACWTRATRRLYAICDDQPVRRRDYYRFIAQLCRAPEPRYGLLENETSARTRSDSNKRVWNRQMKRDLVPRLRYPTYREGLTAVLRSCDGWSR
jgi:nucleoside-diphosphate-sugar epimerase